MSLDDGTLGNKLTRTAGGQRTTILMFCPHCEQIHEFTPYGDAGAMHGCDDCYWIVQASAVAFLQSPRGERILARIEEQTRVVVRAQAVLEMEQKLLRDLRVEAGLQPEKAQRRTY